MSGLTLQNGPFGRGKEFLIEWWASLLGLLAMYGVTVYDLANGIWNTEEQAHGPIILGVVLYVFWQKKKVFLQPAAARNSLIGSGILLLGLLLYVVGRSQDILIFEIGSIIPVLSGVLLITRGTYGLRALWFGVFFVIFMIPLPSIIVDIVTSPLKQHISTIAENVLYQFGYPIARSGVTINIGPYQLLVADACSGLHSMFSLSALGVLYLYLMQYRSWSRNAAIIACILPLAFLANVIRVISLILVTYYLGDDAGQGFVHGFAGIFLFVVALIGVVIFDNFLGLMLYKKQRGAA